MSEKIVNVVFKTIFDRLPNFKDKKDQDIIQNLSYLYSWDEFWMFEIEDSEFRGGRSVWINADIIDILENEDLEKMCNIPHYDEGKRNNIVVKTQILKDSLEKFQAGFEKEDLLAEFVHIHHFYNRDYIRDEKRLRERLDKWSPQFKELFNNAYSAFIDYRENTLYKNINEYFKGNKNNDKETYLLSDVRWAFTNDGQNVIPFVYEPDNAALGWYGHIKEINTSVKGDTIWNIEQNNNFNHNRVQSQLWEEKCRELNIEQNTSYEMLTKYMNKNRSKENLIQFVVYELPKTVVNMDDIRKLKQEFQSNIQRQYESEIENEDN